MTRILIPTFLRDIHATAVAMVLRRRGHDVVVWHGADFPTRQHGSITLSAAGELRWELTGPDLELPGGPFDVVWNRRPSMPVLPPDLPIPEEDRYVAQRECAAFDRALWRLVDPGAFWVNTVEGRARANVKPLQLREAAAVGLRIPPTLISNDPGKIRRFLDRHEEEVIFKPFVPTHWDRGELGVAFSFASSVRLADLPEDEVLRLTPGIFQPRIPKDHELRLTCMGDRLVAARLRSQELAVSTVDWRNAFNRLPVEPTAVADDLAEKCRRLMEKLGIVFGCIDLIVTPAGEVVFLEVNEMGQFLWLDEWNSELNTLAPFCEFLAQGRTDFAWSPGADDPRFVDLIDEALRIQEEIDAQAHVERPHHFLAQEAVAGGSAGEPRPPTANPDRR